MSAGSLTSASVVAVLVLGITIYLWSDRSTHEAAEAPQTVTVDRVIDGDTFIASTLAGEDLGRVRVLGIDTPEKARDGQPAQCHAQTATAAAAKLLQGQSVQISHDTTQDRRDLYGRLLVYVDVDGQDFSEVMLTRGHARIYSGSAIARQRDYDAAAAAAKDQGAGIWGSCP